MKKSTALVGAAALAAAAAGVYMMTGKNAKNRTKVANWAKKMEADVLKELKSAKDTSRKSYDSIVDAVGAKYKGMKDIDKNELVQTAKSLKGHWDTIRREMDQAAKEVKGASKGRTLSGTRAKAKGAVKRMVSKVKGAKSPARSTKSKSKAKRR